MHIEPSLVVLLGAVGAWIAHGQWRTARTKVVLDLFDKRIAVYQEIVEALTPVWRDGGKAALACLASFSKPRDRARFLFGDDVNGYLTEIAIALTEYGCASELLESPEDINDINVVGVAKQQLDAGIKIRGFYRDFGKVAAPYMRVDAKLPLPWWSLWRRQDTGGRDA